MAGGELTPASPSPRVPVTGTAWRVRRARFEDGPALLRLIERSVERGCAMHYRPTQRRAVFLSYAQSLFLDLLGPAETAVGEQGGEIVGVVQLAPALGRLSALFVDASEQGRGHGLSLLAWARQRARQHGLVRLVGAMSLNAVEFYSRAGFRPTSGRRQLVHRGIIVPVLPMELDLL
jgi:N-acetylglutamate synthase-like GNAT family acetyltransferase